MINIAMINKETGICKNIAVFENMETAQTVFGNEYILTQAVDGYGIGDIFKDGKWGKGKMESEPKQQPQKTLEEQVTELQLVMSELYEKMA